MMIAQGSKPAFEELFRRYTGRVVGYCARLVGDRVAGEDLAQEVWIRIAKAAPDWTPRASFKSWLLTIARNLSLNFLRDRKRLGAFTGEGDEEMAKAEASLDLNNESAARNPESLMMKVQDRAALLRAIDQLSDVKRAAVMMWLTEDMSQEQIASELKMNVAGVKSLMFRARQDLERAIGKGGPA